MEDKNLLNPFNSNNLIGLDNYFNELVNLYNSKTFPKVLLLSGKKGSGKFTLIDMQEQMEALTKMGPLGKVMEMVPGMSAMMKKGQVEETQNRLEKFKVLMNSMTKEELENPKLIKRSRINRIAKGSGSDPQEIRDLLKQYNQSKKMMSNIGGNRRMQQKQTAGISRNN